jgi:predicted PhzF superfamily epimerase YddE/YHI9
MDEYPDDEVLLSIASENSVPETAFVVEDDGAFNLRWFTPDIEMDLCGHATLAAAHVLFHELGWSGGKLLFKTISGVITVERESSLYVLDFPIRSAEKAVLPVEIFDSLSLKPSEVYKARDYMLVYDSREEVENVVVDRTIFDEINLDPGGVIITAPGNDSDFVSRFFTPQSTILEDPVTGSAHCTLAPYWAERLGKKLLLARQLSKRGGELYCHVLHESVLLKGSAVTYLKGELFIS